MPVHIEIARLERTVIVVARGHVTPEDIRQIFWEVANANVRSFGKIIDMTNVTSGVELDEILPIAQSMRDGSQEKRGPTALVVDPDNKKYADIFASATQGDRPLRLFHSLHQARRWLVENM